MTTSADLATFETPSFHDRLRRIETNALLRPYTIVSGLAALVGGVVGVVVVTVALAAIDWRLPPLLLAAGIPVLALSRRAGKVEFAFAVAVTPGQRVRRYLREVLIGRAEAKELRSFGAAPALRRAYGDSYDRYLVDLERHTHRKLLLGLAAGSATSAATLATLGLVLVVLGGQRSDLAGVGAALVAVRLLASRVQQVASSIGALFESTLFLADLDAFDVLGAEGDGDRPAAPPLQRVELRATRFRYPETDVDALRGVDVVLRPGEVVALVGENGSGKTTLSKLVAQLFAPTGGTVLWNGVDAERFDPMSRRRQVSVVFQDFVRFGLTAAQNVALGDGVLDPRHDDVVGAATRAGAAGFVEGLPRRYDTMLGKEFDGGVDLSIGQWQRIALARALYRDAPLVVLDEPTAALDARAEHELFESVRTLFAGKAVLLVTHRLSSVRHADRVYVLRDGCVVEHGGHDDLVSAGGLYAELYAMQAAAFA